MALPAIALFLRGALSAAARSGAAGRGIGGVARIGKTAGDYRKARGAADAAKGTADFGKKMAEAGHQAENFKSSLGVNVPEIVKAIKEWRDGLVESGKALAMYNGTIAKAYQELAIGDVQRKMKLSKATAGSTAALAQSENRRRDTTVNWEAFSTNIQNRLATLMNNATAAVGEMLDPIADSLNKLVEIEGPKNDGIIAGLKPLEQLAQRHDRNRPKKIEMGS